MQKCKTRLSCGGDTTATGLGHEEQPGQLPRGRMTSSSPRRLRRLSDLAIKAIKVKRKRLVVNIWQ